MNNSIYVQRPFGPSIAKVKIPEDMVKNLNEYIDKIIEDKKKLKSLDYGSKLAGNVFQEFFLENDFIVKSGWLKFLGENTKEWIAKSETEKEVKSFKLIKTWVVRQFQNEYNPMHVHGGHVSGVGYLKVPDDVGKQIQESKRAEDNKNGCLQLVHGAKNFLSPSVINIKPEVGDFYFFPNYLMHVVYPFSNSDQERRSISFNAEIGDAYNVFSE